MTARRVTRTTAPELPNMFRVSPLRFCRVVLVDFLQGLFSYQPRGSYHWEPNESTEIFVSSETPVKTEEIGTKPGFAVVRAPMQMRTLGLDDMADLDLQTGAKTKMVDLPGTMVINALSRSVLESEHLAFAAGEQLWMLRDLLQKLGFYQIGQDLGFGAPSPAGSIVQGDGADGWFVTAVTVPFHIQRTGRVTPLGRQVAKEISLRIYGNIMAAEESEETYSLSPGLTSTGDSRPEDPEPLRGPGAEPYPEFESTNGIRGPRIKGRQLPITGSTVPESSQRGLDGPLTVKVNERSQ